MSEKEQARQLTKRETAFVAELWPILSELYKAIEDGIAEAHGYFEKQKKEIDWHLFSHLVRWHVCKRLDGKPKVSAVEFEREELSLSGIEVAYGKRTLKVFKADGGLLPPAGKSRRRRGFYQKSLFKTEDDHFKCPNWVVIWETDGGGNLDDLQLVLPKRDGKAHKSGQQVRAIPVPHPAEFTRPKLAYSSDVPKEVEFEDEAAQDLDVALEGGEENER